MRRKYARYEMGLLSVCLLMTYEILKRKEKSKTMCLGLKIPFLVQNHLQYDVNRAVKACTLDSKSLLIAH